MASSLSTHAAARPQARGAAHASPHSRVATASGAMPRSGVMDSARMVAQRQRLADVSGAGSAVGGGTIQRMTHPSAGGQTPGHPTPPASTQGSTHGSSSTDEDTGRRTGVIHYTGAAAMPRPQSRDPGAFLSRDPED